MWEREMEMGGKVVSGGSNGLEGCWLCLPFSSRTKGKGPEVGRELRKSSCVTF